MTFRASVEKYMESVATHVRQGDVREGPDSNVTQYFDVGTLGLRTCQVGGYQVLAKWLKDRKGRFLTVIDTQHYFHIVAALTRTVEAQISVDLALSQDDTLGE